MLLWLSRRTHIISAPRVLCTSATSSPSNMHSVLNNEEVKLPELPGVPIVEKPISVKEQVYKNFIEAQRQKAQESAKESPDRSVFLMRHGERMDFAFGSWVPFCFDESGNYTRKDLNMPKYLPEREGGAVGYQKDSPLTNIGLYEARLVGESFRDQDISVDQVYCSPSYRCVQTCDSVLKGMNREDLPIKVEPGLFEWMAWYPPEYVPKWMTPKELARAGFNIDLDHIPLVSEKEMKENRENCDQFYLRGAYIARSALSAIPRGNVLLVGHSSTLEICSRELIGKNARPAAEMMEMIRQIPFCSVIEVKGTGNSWEINEPPFLPLTHSTNERFDWKLLV